MGRILRRILNIVYIVLFIVVMIGVFYSVSYYIGLPVVYKSSATGGCVSVWTSHGRKDCSWLDENQVKKYEVVWVP